MHVKYNLIIQCCVVKSSHPHISTAEQVDLIGLPKGSLANCSILLQSPQVHARYRKSEHSISKEMTEKAIFAWAFPSFCSLTVSWTHDWHRLYFLYCSKERFLPFSITCHLSFKYVNDSLYGRTQKTFEAPSEVGSKHPTRIYEYLAERFVKRPFCNAMKYQQISVMMCLTDNLTEELHTFADFVKIWYCTSIGTDEQ